MLIAIEAVRAWRDAGHPAHTSCVQLEAIRASRALRKLHDATQEVPGVYWRGTNRRDEYKDVLAGVQILSRNHANGDIEAGMSVSTTLATVWAYKYKYCYKVEGVMIGYGSDGEPLLQEVRPIGRIVRSEVALARDKGPAIWRSLLNDISRATGETPTTIDWVMYQ